MNQISQKNLENILKDSTQIIRNYDWLINSYVLDFYQGNHWSKIPQSWQETLNAVSPEQCSELLSNAKSTVVWPLSILSLKMLMPRFCISRENDLQNRNVPSANARLKNPRLKNIFTKCVKAKKRHEIEKMSEICYRSCQESGIEYVVDFGAGLGHLARVLCYGYDLKVCCLEMQDSLNNQSQIIDNKLEITAAKYLPATELKSFNRPVHITLKLTKSITPDDFLIAIRNAFKVELSHNDFQFGIIGLHSCGDLGPILMKLFLNCKEVKFLNLVGCCYMKLTTNNNDNERGYPLSSFVNNLGSTRNYLSYESREIACHANETYEKCLRTGDYENLKIHSFRAVLEKIIVKNSPHLKHSGLRSVKYSSSMSFQDYCKKALLDLDIVVPEVEINSEENLNDLKQWKNVVIFYTLRLFFAPIIESVILYDRVLYLMENDCDVQISAIFNPEFSPRNHITSAVKTK